MTSIAGLRYVTPLFELAREKQCIEEVEGGIKAISQFLVESPDFKSALLNPQIPAKKKKDIILKVTEDFNSMLRNFFCLLIDKGREQVFLFLEQEFGRLLRESRNLVSACVESPVPLEGEFKQALSQRLAEMTGKSVELTEEVKPELIAGVRILMGSKMLDGSLKARLEGMRRHLKQASLQ